MTTEPESCQSTVDVDGVLKALQHEVQRKLGRSMLRLQEYERLLKAMVAGMAVEGPVEQLQALQDQRGPAYMRNRTLGTLVGTFTGEHLTAASLDVEVGPGTCQIFCVKRGREIIPKGKFHDRRDDYQKAQEAESAVPVPG